METTYTLKNNGIKVASDKKWLKRHGYSKNTIKVYGELAKPLDNLSDAAVASRLKISKYAYQEAKRELVFCGLLEVHRINASHIIYLVGAKAIQENATKNQKREDARMVRLTLEYLGIKNELVEDITEEVHVGDYTPKDIPKPSPIRMDSEDVL